MLRRILRLSLVINVMYNGDRQEGFYKKENTQKKSIKGFRDDGKYYNLEIYGFLGNLKKPWTENLITLFH